MERITRQTCDLFAGLDAQPLKRRGGQERVCDTLELEIECMRRSFGPLWSVLLKRSGLTDIESREEMDRMVNSLLNMGL